VQNKNPLSNLNSIYPVHLFGAEDEGEDVDDTSQVEDTDEQPTPESFDAGYVERLRKENAERRVKAKEAEERAKQAETELAKLRKSEMDDLERVQVEIEEAKVALAQAQAEAAESRSTLLTERIQSTVQIEAIEMGFQDPSDALSMISQDEIVDEDGNVSTKTVKARLKALADKKPYLLKKAGPGSGDGGASGGAPADPNSYQAKIDKYRQEMIESGRVPA
jgi:hypothetical protein